MKNSSKKTVKQSRSPQEDFWAEEFGDEYIRRNEGAELIAGNVMLFSRALKKAEGINSVLEFGANIGCNLRALQMLYPGIGVSGIEINPKAAKQLQNIPGIASVYPVSILDFSIDFQRDLSLSKTVLIHIQPEVLPRVYDLLFQSSRKYILLVEYYNPKPVEISYRGHENRLFKRDFAGEMLDRFNGLKLVDYGFAYHRDKSYAMVQDDLSWFLLEKTE